MGSRFLCVEWCSVVWCSVELYVTNSVVIVWLLYGYCVVRVGKNWNVKGVLYV